jgi:putative methanogenesis marker protein 5
MKVFIFPPNSLILADLVERFGHEPLGIMREIRKMVITPDIDSPPLNVTDKELVRGLRYVAIEAPSGVRGRMGVLGPLIDQAEAAIIIKNADLAFGCSGCDRTNIQVKHLLVQRGIPILESEYPSTLGEAEIFVKRIVDFLEKLRS